MGGGRWAPCDAPVAVDDGYVAAGALGELEAGVCDEVAQPAAMPVTLAIRDMAEGLGLLWDDDEGESDSDMGIGSSPLAARGGRRRGGSGRRLGGP